MSDNRPIPFVLDNENFWNRIKKVYRSGKRFVLGKPEPLNHTNSNQNFTLSTSSSSPNSVTDPYSFNRLSTTRDSSKQAKLRALYKDHSNSPTSSISESVIESHQQEIRNRTKFIPSNSNCTHGALRTSINDMSGHSIIKMKLVLLDSLILRLKRFYGEEAEIICDQALFAAILDIKRTCKSSIVNLAILDDIEIVYQQLIDNEAIFRLERTTKLETSRWERELAASAATTDVKKELEFGKLALKSRVMLGGVVALSLVVGIFICLAVWNWILK